MACYKPKSAQERADGSIGFYDQAGDVRSLLLPCGHCIGCRLDRAVSWSVRCMHEASLYDANTFLTLTYEDAYLPFVQPDGEVDRGAENMDYGSRPTLWYRDVQLFLKRLRKAARGNDPGPRLDYPIRFFASGEYGSLAGRPHYHLLLFNYSPPNQVRVAKDLFESERLSDLWPMGSARCGFVTPASAAYVSQYSMKKVYGRVESEEHYGNAVPEFIKMSIKPGIGSWWYEKYSEDVLPRDYVIADGKKIKVPRYYAEKFKTLFPEDYDVVVESRERESIKRARGDSGRSKFDRLRAAEAVTESRYQTFNSRSL